MFKDFLVPLLMGDIPSPIVHTACAMAKAWRGRVIALVGVSQAAPIPEAWSYYPAGVYQNMRDCALATTQSMAEAADARLHYEGVPYEIRRSEAFWSTPEEISVEHARYADITVLGMDTNEHDARHRLFAAVAVGSGRPVLCVPAYKALPADFGHAVVAWHSGTPTSEVIVYGPGQGITRCDFGLWALFEAPQWPQQPGRSG